MRKDTLIVEDVMLLLLDDETGAVAGAGTLHYTLGGAVLAELALLGRIGTDGGRPGADGPRLRPLGEGPLDDPLLQSAYDKIAERPRGVQTHLLDIGGRLRKPVIDRLIERGLIRRRSKRVLGLFPTTQLPAGDPRHEAALRRKIRAALEDGERTDDRTAAVIALLSSSGTLPSLRPALPWSAEVRRRAKEFESGHWGAEAVNTAVTRTAAAIAASTAVVTATIITTT